MTLEFGNNKMPPVRAICAILIILGHFSYFGVTGMAFLRILAPVCVSLFLFISGYGLMVSYQKKGKVYLQAFFKNRLLKIVIPAVLVALLHLLLHKGSGVGILERSKLIFTKGTTLLPHYWFVWAILFDYLAFWLSCSYISEKWQKWTVLLCSLVFMVATYSAGFDRCWWVCSLAFPTGLFFAAYKSSIYSFCSKRNFNFFLALTLCGLLFIGLFLTGNPMCWSLCYVFIPATAALIIARLPLDRFKLPILRFLGAISYELYLTHITVMSFLRGNLVYISPNALFVASVLFLTLGLAYGLHVLCKLITPTTK